MPKVIVLPEHIASQIAAGEVVERPASVVKELAENAIDSGATQIEVAIASDCRDIRVADNGCGMEPEDAVLAFQRHATSKLQKTEDLSSLRTLGFRGEALPSIASVARFSCYTRTREASSGTRVDCQDGQVTARETGCAHGTLMEVTDLFYNVPARLSFMKKPSTEFGHIHEIVQSLAIAYPKLAFQLLNEGEVILKTSGSGKLAQATQEAGIVSGREELINVTSADTRYGLAVYGYVARPPHCRGDRRGLVTIVNNRPVKCPVTLKALDYAFSDLIPKGRHPLGVITITIDPAEIDVNIHPTKKEIKYRNGSDVYLAVQSALKSGLRAVPVDEPTAGSTVESVAVAPTAAPATTYSGITYGQERSSLVAERPAARPRTEQLSIRERLSYAPSPVPPPGTPLASPITDPADPANNREQVTWPAGWRLLGYLHNTYFLVQTSEGLMIVEQHIAHERVIYERLLAQQETPGRTNEYSQNLVLSAPLNLSKEQRACLEENLEVLQKLGFDFDLKAQQAACTRVPLELATKDYAGSIQTYIENLLASGNTNFSLEATKSVACQAAIKDGMPLSESEIIELLSEWNRCPRNDTCPHGRPIALRYSKDKLFQMFHPD